MLLLWHGKIPSPTELSDFKSRLFGKASLNPEVASFIDGVPEKTKPLNLLRTVTSLIGMLEVEDVEAIQSS